ncbi:MAG: hypothetical protein AAB964_02390, partial [Patescibacteria group bacterium]
MKKLFIAAALLLVTLGIAFAPLFSGRIVAEDDVAHYYIPAFKFYDDARAAGEDPTLAPGIFSGFPLGLTQVGGYLDPLNALLFDLFPFLTAYHLRILLNYFLAGIFT